MAFEEEESKFELRRGLLVIFGNYSVEPYLNNDQD